jgi:TRAP transporter TAXI family solute receptor
MHKKKLIKLLGSVLLFWLSLIIIFLPSGHTKSSPKLPEVITMTTLPIGGTKYVESTAFRKAIEQLTTMKLRLESVSTDLERVGPLKTGESEFAYITGGLANGAARGVGNFKVLGPIPIRRVWNGYPFVGAMWCRADAGFKTIADLKGKRLPQAPGSYEWSLNNAGILAFGGLTLKDVQIVTVSSIGAGMRGPLEGALDATQGAVFAPEAATLSASPHGIYWFDMPPTDAEGWKRQKAVAPWANPIKTGAMGLKKGETITGAGYENGIYSTPGVSEDIIYAFCKAMKEGYGIYKQMHKGLDKWTWERAYILDIMPQVPYHAGTVKFFKEMGVWSEAHEKFQQTALKAEKERLGK